VVANLLHGVLFRSLKDLFVLVLVTAATEYQTMLRMDHLTRSHDE